MATATSPTTADLAEVRRSIRDSATEVEERHLAELERVDAGPGKMMAPDVARRTRTAWGGTEYRRRGQYDWFDGLSRAEQARLRERWFTTSPTGQSPDEVFEKISERDWLQNTRIADASRALASGRAGEYNPKRFGNLSPNALIHDEPYDVRKIWSNNEKVALAEVERGQGGYRQGADWRSRMWGSSQDHRRCQFRTRPDGTVYPLAGTCRDEDEGPTYTAEEIGEAF